LSAQLEVQRIEVDDGINRRQGQILPSLDQQSNFVRDGTDRVRRDLNPMDLLKHVLDVASRYPFAIYCQDFLFQFVCARPVCSLAAGS
jgi:hypothetical protein